MTARQVEAISYVYFFVQNAEYWSEWFCNYLDFELIPNQLTENQLKVTVLQQGKIQIRISDPNSVDLNANQNPVAEYLAKHPPGVAEIGLIATNINSAHALKSQQSVLTSSNCDLVYRLDYEAPFISSQCSAHKYSLFSHIDHLVINLPQGKLTEISKWYEQNLGLGVSDRFNIQTDRSGLESLVLENHNGNVQIPLNQPSNRNSQIQEFLDYNRGMGVQHLALHTDQIERTVDILQQRGVQFLQTSPAILYEEQDRETGKGIWQIFTQPLFEQPTFFLEIIQRREGAIGFGAGNFQALFEAIEQQQISRTNLGN